eukprot:s109_g30.t2
MLHKLEQMLHRDRGLNPTCATLTSAISACGKGHEWESALSLLAQMPTLRLQPNVYSFSAAISSCEKGGQWQRAVALLAEMPQRKIEANVYSFSSTLSALAQSTERQRALNLLEEMPARGIEPVIVSINAALDACGKDGCWQEALALLHRAERDSLQPAVVSYSAAINACGKSSEWALALGLFSDMQTLAISPNTISYSAAISACEKEWQSALALWETLKSSPHAEVDIVGYSAVISACAKGSEWPLALQLLDEMRQGDLYPNVICYNAAASACGNAQMWAQALQLLAAMTWFRVLPSVRSYNTVISACDGERWELATGLFAQMQDENLQPDVVTYNSIIFVFERADHQWTHAAALLEEMAARDVEPSTTTFNTAMNAHFKDGNNVESVFALLRSMRTRKLRPDVISFNTAIGVCEAGGHWQQAFQLLQDMRHLDVAPDLVSYNCLFNVCYASGQWGRVLEVVQDMVAHGIDGFSECRYDHLSQAGSSLDCFKHAVLISLLASFTKEPGRFTYIDTHAGRGVYDLTMDGALQDSTFEHGIKLLDRAQPKTCFTLTQYLAQLRSYNGVEQGGHLRHYLGSAALAARWLRPGDQAVCFELASTMYKDLAQFFKSGIGASVKLISGNSYWWLLHHMEEDLRANGLILMDPPYEPYNEYTAWNLFLLRHLHEFSRFCVAVWYPCFTPDQMQSLYAQLYQLDIGDLLVAEFQLLKPSAASLTKSVVVILRPPESMDATLKPLLAELGHLLQGRLGVSFQAHFAETSRGRRAQSTCCTAVAHAPVPGIVEGSNFSVLETARAALPVLSGLDKAGAGCAGSSPCLAQGLVRVQAAQSFGSRSGKRNPSELC